LGATFLKKPYEDDTVRWSKSRWFVNLPVRFSEFLMRRTENLLFGQSCITGM
jgi:hypothetical protein